MVKGAGAAVMALCLGLIAATFRGRATHALSTVLFFINGLVHVAMPKFVTNYLVGGGGRKYPNFAMRCERDLPWSTWAWDLLEREALSWPPVLSRPVREVRFDVGGDAACRETLTSRGDGWHKPFVIRGGSAGVGPTPEQIADMPDVPLRTIAANMLNLSDQWQDLRRCPHKRKRFSNLHATGPFLRGEQRHLYVNFDSLFIKQLRLRRRARLRKGKGNRTGAGAAHEAHSASMQQGRSGQWLADLDKRMLEIKSLCGGVFNGYGNEAFMGFGAAPNATYRVGTPLHAAGMANLFLQVSGERTWALLDPAWSQYVRARHGDHYVIGLGSANDWRSLARPAHWDRLPRQHVVTRPGDVLFIPPWWWHEVSLDNPGEFSLGTSNRGFDYLDPAQWYRWPVLRFVPWFNSGPWSLNRLALDLVHTLPASFREARGERVHEVEQTQHSKHFP